MKIIFLSFLFILMIMDVKKLLPVYFILPGLSLVIMLLLWSFQREPKFRNLQEIRE